MPSAAFLKFWRTDLTRDCFLSHATVDDLRSLRLVSREFAVYSAPVLFADIRVTFGVSTLSRQVRMLALERIGHHVKKVGFNMPHDANTFLPPLIDPESGLELHFIYEPSTYLPSRPSSSSSSSTSSSRYGSFELHDLLIKQYPPLFHAATNIHAFQRFVAALPNLRHLHISYPGQPSGQRYRRSSVDYALISLRMALECSNPRNLTHLTLSPIPPSSVWYLRSTPLTIGASPASTRLWRRITHLAITMSSFPFSVHDNTSDHLKILHSYLTTFQALTSLQFTWLDSKGPSPLSSDLQVLESLLAPEIKNSTRSASAGVCKPASDDVAALPPRPCTPPTNSNPGNNKHSLFPPLTSVSQRPLKFRRLKTLSLTNTTIDASTTSTFIHTHRKTLDQVDFDHCEIRGGSWEEAFGPLLKKRRRKKKKTPTDDKQVNNNNNNNSNNNNDNPAENSTGESEKENPPTPPPKPEIESMEVPIVFRQVINPVSFTPVPLKETETLCEVMWNFSLPPSKRCCLIDCVSRKSRLLMAVRRVGGWFGM